MNQSHAQSRCIGVLYCGDLGTALANVLRKTGARVVTTCEGRSSRTQQRARSAGVEILGSLSEVIEAADVLFSVVLPDAALDVAQQCFKYNDLVAGESFFVDVNSIGLTELSSMEALLAETRFRFVDSAIHGGASHLEQKGVVYVSGPHAQDIETLFAQTMRVMSLGTKIGQATRMKLLMAAQSKCLNLLFLQIANLAHNAQMLEEFLAESRRFYPEIMVAIERMLPTYPRHGARRITELQNIENFAQAVDAPSEIIASARDLLQSAVGQWNNAATPPSNISEIIRLTATTPCSHQEKEE